MTPDRSREAFRDLLAGADRPAVVRLTVSLDDADVTPLSAYAALSERSEYGFLLESAEKVASSDPDGAFAPATAGTDRHVRFSFVGYDPEAVVTVDPDGATVESLGGRAADLVDADPSAGDTLDVLRSALPDVDRVGFDDRDRQRLDGGLVGFLAYDAVYDLWLEEVGIERPGSGGDGDDGTNEGVANGGDGDEVPTRASDRDGSEVPSRTPVPDAQFVLTTRTIAFDHAEDAVELVLTPIVRGGEDPDAVYDDLLSEAENVRETLAATEEPIPGGFDRRAESAGPREEYEAAVREAKERVRDGDIYQGVISRTRELRGEIDPQGLYAALREVNPSPYMYLLRHGDRAIVGASPETLVSVRGDRVVANPIAGTCARGISPVEDRRLAGEMLADGKERAEHTMLVDLARNDVRRVAEAGSVRVEEFMNVLKYSHVQHIESTVTGALADEFDAFDATRAAFPAGTLTGAPKVRAMEIIDDLERTARGVYGGGVGYYSWTGDADVAIVIRTATVERGVPRPDGDGVEDAVTVRAGAGIVADSDPAAEFEETEQKMGGVLDAIERIEGEESADAGGGDDSAADADAADPSPTEVSE